ncbi:AsmA family protein [Planktotalea sp.]|uniref:AsmA family protein n=1 Tax=Planktotalea sp. TaxID=2029877 RepID=UPI003297A049
MRFLIRLIVIVLVAVVLAIVGLMMLPGDKIASVAATQLSKQTGREVSISPDTSISFYPTLGVTTGPASIGTADWAKNGPLFTSDGLTIGVNVPALITGTIKVTKLEAKSPRVILERAADGRANWEFSPSAEATIEDQTTVATETTDADGDQSFDLSLARALITDASLRYIDHAAGTDQSFEDIDLDLRWPDLGGAADVILGATPFGERVELDATIANIMGLTKGEQSALSGTLVAADASIKFEGVASIKPEAAMQLTGSIPNAGAFLNALGQDPAALGLAADFDPNVSIDSQVSFDGTRLALRQMTLGLNDSTINGDADIVLALGEPQVTAKLNADVKNAGQLMRMVGQAPEGFGLNQAFDPNLSSAITLSTSGANVSAKLSDLNITLEDAQIAGQADIALQNNVPNVAATLSVNMPNAGRTAALLGQPLNNFGLSSNAAPAVKTNVSASVKGTNINAQLRDLAASLGGAAVTGAIDLTLAGSTPNVSGNINANIPSTANLMSALGQSAPSIPKGFGQAIKASTSLSFKSDQLDLSGLNVTLDQNTLSGGVSVNLGSSVPNITANLQAGALDFSALAPADSESSSSSSSSSTGWSKDRIDASALGLINGNISLKASSIDLGLMQLSNANLGVAIDRSRAVVSINNLNAYEGSFAGQLVANNRNGLSVAGDLKANSVALNPLLVAFAEIDKIAGDASFNLDFLGSGASVDAIMRSLSGSLGLSIPSGTIAGIDLEGLINQGNANASLTKFENMSATGVISGGNLQSNDLTVTTGRVNAKGEGYVNLGAQTIDYLVTPIAKEVGSQDRIDIPIRIKGPWSSPAIRPDLEAALNLENERKKLEEQARQEVERQKEKLREQAEAEAAKLEEKARAKVEEAAKKAAEKAAAKLKLDATKQKQIEDAAKKALEDKLGSGLKNLLGGN